MFDHNSLQETAKQVLLTLNASDVEYALCGGLAVGVHGHIRATKDIDVVLASATDLDKASVALAADGWLQTSQPIEFDNGFILHRRILAVGSECIILDLLLQPSGDNYLEARLLDEFDGAACWVVSLKQLLRMKKGAGRPQDLADIDHLSGPVG